jgi:hypothetical protein
MVVAPSMIPRKSGERQKTDKRDAANLAVLQADSRQHLQLQERQCLPGS